jgi:hypothetical protein
MNWIRIATGISDDPEVGRIADACGIPIAYAVGCVVSLLCRLPEHARTGDVSTVPDRTLEQWALFEGKRGTFAKAFREHLCEGGVVKAWERHNGAAIREADAARDRMKAARRAKRSQNDTGEKAEPFAERSANRSPNVRGTVRRTFHSYGTGRDVTTPSKPDGLDGPPALPGPKPAETGPLFAEWEQQLFAAALPHEAAALEHLAAKAFRPAVIGELYAIASGQHVVRGAHPPYREANAADVMRAVSEYACKPDRGWNQSYFRGVVRKILDRPAEPPDAEAREQERLARQVSQSVTVPLIESPRTDAEIEAGRARREAALAAFRREFHRNNPEREHVA